MMNEEKEARDKDIVDTALQLLGEHFDTCQIFCTRYEHDADGDEAGTINVQMGTGNWFARYGHVKTWVKKMDENHRIAERNSQEEDDS